MCVRVCVCVCVCVQFKHKCLMLEKNHFIKSPIKNGSPKRYIRLINVNQLTKLKNLGKNYQKECWKYIQKMRNVNNAIRNPRIIKKTHIEIPLVVLYRQILNLIFFSCLWLYSESIELKLLFISGGETSIFSLKTLAGSLCRLHWWIVKDFPLANNSWNTVR